MTTAPILCTRCMRWHLAPMCDHDSALPCFSCGRPRGYRWTDDDGKAAGRAIECWRCWWAVRDAATKPTTGPQDGAKA